MDNIKVVCAWCGYLMKDGDDKELESHSICKACLKKEIAKIKKLTK